MRSGAVVEKTDLFANKDCTLCQNVCVATWFCLAEQRKITKQGHARRQPHSPSL